MRPMLDRDAVSANRTAFAKELCYLVIRPRQLVGVIWPS